MKDNAIFAIYKGDKFLDIGTAEELAEKFNVTPKTIYFYSTKAYLKRFNKSKELNRLITIKLEKDEEENEKD